MADHDLDAGFELTVIPVLSFLSGHRGSQDRNTEAGRGQHTFETRVDIFLTGIRGVDLATATLPQLFPDVFDQGCFLRVDRVLAQFPRSRHHELVELLRGWIVGSGPDFLEAIRMIR